MIKLKEVTWDVVYSMFEKEIIDSIRTLLNTNGFTSYHIPPRGKKGIPTEVLVFSKENILDATVSNFVNSLCTDENEWQQKFMRSKGYYTEDEIWDLCTFIHFTINDENTYFLQKVGYRIINDIPYEVSE